MESGLDKTVIGRVTVHQTKEILEDYNIRTQLGELVVARYCNINKDEKNEDVNENNNNDTDDNDDDNVQR